MGWRFALFCLVVFSSGCICCSNPFNTGSESVIAESSTTLNAPTSTISTSTSTSTSTSLPDVESLVSACKARQLQFDRQMCLFNLALDMKDPRICENINDKDYELMCYGVVKKNSSVCSSIRERDQNYMCHALSEDNPQLCSKIRNEEREGFCNWLMTGKEQATKNPG